jgi:hypothetical protein
MAGRVVPAYADAWLVTLLRERKPIELLDPTLLPKADIFPIPARDTVAEPW